MLVERSLDDSDRLPRVEDDRCNTAPLLYDFFDLVFLKRLEFKLARILCFKKES